LNNNNTVVMFYLRATMLFRYSNINTQKLYASYFSLYTYFQVINDMMMSMNIQKVEVKTANFLESWGGAITLLVTGLVQLKGYPVRKRFVQTILLAPKKDGYFVFSDIFKFICDEYDDQYHGVDHNCVENIPQVDAPYTMAETGISSQHY
jgi:hypothetical protein